MKCSKVQRLIVENEDGEMPADIAQHLDSCSACKYEYERSLNLQKLLSLKQYEASSPEANERRVLSIHRTIQETINPQSKGADNSILAWLTLEPLPVLRYAIAALLIAVLGIHFLLMPKLQPGSEVAASAPANIPPAEAPSMYADITPNPQTDLYADLGSSVPAVSNAQPNGIQYGPYRSTVVDYEY